jgi:acetyltransferase-like isoleucine patch superfamily enzyme
VTVTTDRLDNVPRALFDGSRSARQKYQELVVGRPGWGALIRYEVVIALASRWPGALGLALRSKLYPGLLASCGRGVFFGVDTVLRHPHKVRIGDRVAIDDHAVLDAKGTSNRGITVGSGVFVGRYTMIYTKDGDIELEDGANLSSFCSVFSASRVRIGSNTLLASYVYVVGGGHAFERTDVAVVDQARPSRGIAIGPNGWIGAGSVVLDGVTIGRDVIVGANSVVVEDLPDFAIAAGTPARVLRIRGERA